MNWFQTDITPAEEVKSA